MNVSPCDNIVFVISNMLYKCVLMISLNIWMPFVFAPFQVSISILESLRIIIMAFSLSAILTLSNKFIAMHGSLTRYAKLQVVHAPGMPGTFSPPPTSKETASDPSMHHGTCITHVPWCMSGSLTRGGEEDVTDNPCACATRNLAYLVRGPWAQRRPCRILPLGKKHIIFIWHG